LGSPEVPEVWVPVCRACQVLPSDIPRLDITVRTYITVPYFPSLSFHSDNNEKH